MHPRDIYWSLYSVPGICWVPGQGIDLGCVYSSEMSMLRKIRYRLYPWGTMGDEKSWRRYICFCMWVEELRKGFPWHLSSRCCADCKGLKAILFSANCSSLARGLCHRPCLLPHSGGSSLADWLTQGYLATSLFTFSLPLFPHSLPPSTNHALQPCLKLCFWITWP